MKFPIALAEQPRRNPAVRFPGWGVCGAIALIVFTGHSFAQMEQSDLSPAELKKLSLEELIDVEVISVSKAPQKLLDAAAAIQVVTGDDILRSGASSIPEALRLADNLDVAQKGSHAWAISARGFNTDSANKLLVLMDGRSVYTPLFSGVFWDVQDYLLQDVDRIEVISGPGGTLWGANAVNGVINVISKSAKDTQGFYVEGGGGSELQDFGGVRYGGTLAPNVYFRVYGKYFDRDSEVFPNGMDASDSWRMGQGGFRMDAEPCPENTLTLQGDAYFGDENLATGGSAKVNGNNVLGRWSHTFSADSDMSLQVYYDRTHLNDPIPANDFAAAGRLIDDLHTYDLDFQHRFLIWATVTILSGDLVIASRTTWWKMLRPWPSSRGFWIIIYSVHLRRTRSRSRRNCPSRSERRSSITITPDLNSSRVRDLPGRQRISKPFGRRFLAQSARPRVLTAISGCPLQLISDRGQPLDWRD